MRRSCLSSWVAVALFGTPLVWTSNVVAQVPSAPAAQAPAGAARTSDHPTDQATGPDGLPTIQSSLGALGDPAGAARQGAGANVQKLDRYGTSFRTSDPPLVISELAFGHGAGESLPGTVKLGAWENFGSIPAFISPSIGPAARRLHGDGGLYGIVDQMLYRWDGVQDGSVGAFARLAGAPSDRNLISIYADAGILATGMVPGRPQDAAGASFAFAQVSAAARSGDVREGAALGVPYPIRSNELVFEVTYQAQIVPGFTLQPEFQYVVRPGGGVPAPFDASYPPVRDAAVVGLRATMRY